MEPVRYLARLRRRRQALAVTRGVVAMTVSALALAVSAAEPAAELQARLQAIEAIVEAADNDAWVNLFSADAVVMPPNSSPVQGRDAIRKLYAPAYSGYADIQVNYELQDIDVEGGMAVMRYAGEATLTRESGQSYRSSTHYVDVLRRQPGG